MSANNLNEYFLVVKDDMQNFMERCMLAAGAKLDHAKSLASCLIAGDHRGHFSHGLNRLGIYYLKKKKQINCFFLSR
jgi:LDH2 family malate/lactate/ureidoglycolate dehydrogenase